MQSFQSGDLRQAEIFCLQMVQKEQSHAEAWHLLGIISAQRGDYDGAVRFFSKAVEFGPDNHIYHFNLGNAYSDMGKTDEAIDSYEKALSLAPGDPETYNNLAAVLEDKGLIDSAIENYKKAVKANPVYADAYNNLALVFWGQGRVEEAIENYKRALQINPEDAEVHNNLAMAYLLAKVFSLGWKEYEWRRKSIHMQPFLKPGWDGDLLEGKTIMVYGEQGYGDLLQFARYLPGLQAQYKAEKVLFRPNKKGLEYLLRESGLKAEILDADTPVENLEYDTNIHLLSLPGIFRTDLDNMPFRQKRYLKAKEEKVAWYRENYFNPQPKSQKPKLIKVGIFWQGSPTLGPDKNRSMPLSNFYPLCRLPGVKVYSFQKGYGLEQLEELPEDIEIVNLGKTFDDFSDTAAALMDLDIMITVDTAIGHLSGALGKRTWILLPSHAEWRWHLDMDYSPWYEDVKLFRPKEIGKKDWEEMMDRVVEQVKVLLY